MFDLITLRDRAATHGTIARVVIAATRGSTPREAGASMTVWATGRSGTIGGGTLEYRAAAEARAVLAAAGRATTVTRLPLGPAMNQCCGGAVTLVTEVITPDTLAAISGHAFARRVEGTAPLPGQIARATARAAAMGAPAPFLFAQGWLSEPLTRAALPVVIHGAGHVGQALAAILAPLPEFAVTLADDRQKSDKGPMEFRCNSDAIPIPISGALSTAPDHAHHLVMTHAHDLDLDICHRLLSRRTGAIGLIGSATKWARFCKRLQGLGHSSEAIARIACPVGDPTLGKHPQAIALGVATGLLGMVKSPSAKREAI